MEIIQVIVAGESTDSDNHGDRRCQGFQCRGEIDFSDSFFPKLFYFQLATIYDTKMPVGRKKIQDISKAGMKAKGYYKHVVFCVEKFLSKVRQAETLVSVNNLSYFFPFPRYPLTSTTVDVDQQLAKTRRRKFVILFFSRSV